MTQTDGNAWAGFKHQERQMVQGLSDRDLCTYLVQIERELVMSPAHWLRSLHRIRARVAASELRWRKMAERKGGPAVARERWSDRVDRIKRDMDIVREIEITGVPLRQRGQEWLGLCPFHSEKTPSFSVQPEKGLWLCRGCGRGGDIFTFYAEKMGLEFPQVLAMLEERMSPLLILAQSDFDKILDVREQREAAGRTESHQARVAGSQRPWKDKLVSSHLTQPPRPVWERYAR